MKAQLILEIKSLNVPTEFAFHVNEAGLLEKRQKFKGKDVKVNQGQMGVFTAHIDLPNTFHPRKSASQINYKQHRLLPSIQRVDMPPSYTGHSFEINYKIVLEIADYYAYYRNAHRKSHFNVPITMVKQFAVAQAYVSR
jgi:hypothetical protein